MIRSILLLSMLILVSIVSVSSVWACFDPSDIFSGEVLLNKPGISYNFSLLARITGIVRVSDNVYIYRSHIGNAIVIIYIEECINGVPVLSIHGEQGGEIEYYPGIRVEPITIPTGGVGRENITLELKKIFSFELKWLSDIGVIRGITVDDIESIASCIKAGYAGWNNRLIYYTGDGNWHPYYELVSEGLIEGVLLRSIGCRWEIPGSIVPSQPPEYTIQQITSSSTIGENAYISSTNTTTISPVHTSGETPMENTNAAISEHTTTHGNGYYVLIAVLAGLLVAVALSFALRR